MLLKRILTKDMDCLSYIFSSMHYCDATMGASYPTDEQWGVYYEYYDENGHPTV